MRFLIMPFDRYFIFLFLTGQALGKLMATIGSKLDTDKNSLYMKEIFRLLDRHANNKYINSRMRFMIRDLDELRVSFHLT